MVKKPTKKAAAKSTKLLITDYAAAWHTGKDKGAVKLKFAGQAKYATMKISSNVEFLAALALLQGPKSVVYDTKTTYLHTA